jgi:hypothetical protein
MAHATAGNTALPKFPGRGVVFRPVGSPRLYEQMRGKSLAIWPTLDLLKAQAVTQTAIGKTPKAANPIVYDAPPAWFTADAHIDVIPPACDDQKNG